MIGWIRFEDNSCKLTAHVERKGRRFDVEGEIPLKRGTKNRTRIASKELDNLIYGLQKITKGVFYGRKI